jgi:hypothetical protein
MMASQEKTVLFDETFTDGLDTGRWQVFQGEGFAADDGVATPTAQGVSIAPPARDPQTGEPAFTKVLEGFVGNIKWLALAGESFATDDGELRFLFRAGARGFGLERHPYGEAVADPAVDFRLGSATLNVLDFETGLVFDFWISDGAISVFYERLRMPETGHEHEAFTNWLGPIHRSSSAVHDLCIAVNAGAGTVRWEVDGNEVARIDRIGPSAADWGTVLDHGGAPEQVTPRRLQVGLGMMTLLQGSFPPGNHGLVDLGQEDDYLGERLGPAKTFQGGPLLFGQGVELAVERITVERN